MRAALVVIACAMAAVAIAAPLPQAAVQASGIPSGERQALIDLYTSTQGWSWTSNTNWNGTAGTECTWFGVVCDQGQTTVLQLILGKNNLVGTIPASLANLTNLTKLHLHENKLTGSIPSELGNLNWLQSLSLASNQLTGSIPASLGSLTNLLTLELSGNQLTGSIPTELGNLANLQYLDLDSDRLSGSIPAQFGGLTNLKSLDLHRNQLSGSIPNQLGSLTNLQYLYLNGNMLSGAIPTSLESLTNLVAGQSDLSYNALYSTDATLTTFLNGKQSGGDWQATQTVAPTGVAAGPTNDTSVALSWWPIRYIKGTGGYETYYSMTSGGPYMTGGITANKIAQSIVVSALNPGTLYYFVVRTVTNPNDYNQNAVMSDPSVEVYATTTGTACTSPSITSQPQSQSIQSGQTATLSVTATGTAPLSYQWYRGASGEASHPVGTNASGYTTPALTATTSYWVRVSNWCGYADSTTATVSIICTSPSITSQPQSQGIQSGQTATLTVTATGSGTLAYQWYQGASGNLSSTPVGTNASNFTTPALTATASYWVRVSNSCGYADSATATIRVMPYFLWVPVASHNGGQNNSQWRSDLGLLNAGTVRANVQITFFGSDGVVSKTTYVPPGTQSILTDVVGQLPASGSGAIEVLSDQPLKVTARSYNQVSSDASCYANGTQGQDYPAAVASDGLAAGQSAYLAGLAENTASYRSNIGLVNVGSGAATVLVELFNGDGTKLTDYTVSLNPGEWKQETQPFYNKAAQTAMDRGYAKITVQTGLWVFGFASVIDNITNDPTTVTMQPAAAAQLTQQSSKLVGAGGVGAANEGRSVAISADGDTAIVGGDQDNSGGGAAWVFTRSGAMWSQQGSKLVGSDHVGAANEGRSVAISADGNTAIVGGLNDNSGAGAAWVYARSDGVWSQQGSKLVGAGGVGAANEGRSVAISGDGNTAIVGGWGDNSGAGAAWVFTRSGGVWSQQGSKLVGSGAAGPAYQGTSVAISADGNTAIVGGWGDNSGAGAAWVFTRSGGVWSQQGSKLVGSGAAGPANQGTSVAISAGGTTAIVGGWGDNSGAGAAWVYTRSGGVWSQQGSKLVGSGAGSPYPQQGTSVAISAGGTTVIVGGSQDNTWAGAAWVFTRSGGVWSQQGSKLVGSGAAGPAYQGTSVAISAGGTTAIVGGRYDNSGIGAAWVFVASGSAVPSVSGQPQGQSIQSGQTAGLSVTTAGATPLSYQWHQGALGETSLPVGTNASSFTTPALTTTRSYWVPVASHNGGKNNSQWRSDLGMLNTGSITANVQITFFGSSGVVSKTTYVPAGTQSILADVVGQLNGSNSGALEILSDQPLTVTARSYNQVAPDASCYAGGTQGQDYPAVVASDGLAAGQSAYLAGLVENIASYRSNIGVVNVGSGAATVLVELFDGAGNKLTDYTVNLNPGDWKQETQPFYNKAAQTAMDRGYAKITVQSGSGVFGFASVIDNTTNDPTTVAMQR